jgi:hypothetical protein
MSLIPSLARFDTWPTPETAQTLVACVRATDLEEFIALDILRDVNLASV